MPVWKNRELIGHASSIDGARRVILSSLSYPNNAFILAIWGKEMNRDQIKRMMGDEPEPDPLWLRLAWIAFAVIYAIYFLNM